MIHFNKYKHSFSQSLPSASDRFSRAPAAAGARDNLCRLLGTSALFSFLRGNLSGLSVQLQVWGGCVFVWRCFYYPHNLFFLITGASKKFQLHYTEMKEMEWTCQLITKMCSINQQLVPVIKVLHHDNAVSYNFPVNKIFHHKQSSTVSVLMKCNSHNKCSF